MNIAALALAAALAAAPSDELTLTAKSVNVSQPGAPVTIKILRWSTDEERAPMMAALNPAPAQRAGLPAEAGRNANPAPAGRGAVAGRGRGRGRGGPAAPINPIAAFAAALGRAPTLGYIWTNDITGYSIKYAWRSALPDGAERIVLASDRRLGAYSDAWKPLAAETDYAFTLLELRVESNKLIEGKTSLTNKIVVDAEAKTIALENHAAAAASLAPTSAAGKPPRPSR